MLKQNMRLPLTRKKRVVLLVCVIYRLLLLVFTLAQAALFYKTWVWIEVGTTTRDKANVTDVQPEPDINVGGITCRVFSITSVVTSCFCLWILKGGFAHNSKKQCQVYLVVQWILLGIGVTSLLLVVTIFDIMPMTDEYANSWIFFGAAQVFKIVEQAVETFAVPRMFQFDQEQEDSGSTNTRKLSKDELEVFFNGCPELDKIQYQGNNVISRFSYKPYLKEKEIRGKQLVVDKSDLLGSGQFGKVFKGFLKGQSCDKFCEECTSCAIVAVKTIREGNVVVPFDKEQLAMLISELKVMLHVGEHPRIVGFLGACTKNIKNGELAITLEFCENGSLERFLRNEKHTFQDFTPSSCEHYAVVPGTKMRKESDLLRFAIEVAEGMEFLESRRVVHGDLACRNILLTNSESIKITDFGMSRRFHNYKVYAVNNEHVMLPWRWMSIETLQDSTFSFKTDVWSYGVTIWEIFSFAQMPYCSNSTGGFVVLEWNDNFIDMLSNGARLSKPPNVSMEIYNIMRECWRLDPRERPNFEAILDILNSVFSGTIT